MEKAKTKKKKAIIIIPILIVLLVSAFFILRIKVPFQDRNRTVWSAVAVLWD